MKFRFNLKYALLVVLLFCIEVLIATKLRHIDFVRNVLGDVIVVALVYCFIQTFLKINYIKAIVFTFLFACFIEFLQYIKFVDLMDIQNKIARIVIGTTFTWHDIFAYFIGSLVVFFVEFLIRRNQIEN